MLKYINEEDYINLMDASSIPNDFNQKVIEASNYINTKTFNRIDENNVSEKVKYVTCLLINKIIEKEEKLSEIGNLKSENVEGWQTTYATPEEVKSDYSNQMYGILKEYLMFEIGVDGLPLLYIGVI